MPVPRECRFTRLIVDRFNYRSMLVVLVAVYVLYGLLLKSALRDSVLLVTMTLLLVSGILAARPTRTGFWVSASLALAGFVLTALDVLFNHHYHGLWVAGLISYTLFELLTIVILLRSILYVRRVTSEGISAALCVYFLLGLLWTNAYLLLEDLSPGQFDFGNKKTMVAHILENAEQHGYEGAAAERAARHATNGMLLIYLSLTTLTTLGYGDVTPCQPTAMTLTTLEAFLGQIYLTVMVAWLVGLHVSYDVARRRDRRDLQEPRDPPGGS